MASQSPAFSKPTWYRYFWLLVCLWLLAGAGAVAIFVVKENIPGIVLTSLVFCIILQLAYWYSRMWVFRQHRRQIRANLLNRRANDSSLSYDPAKDKPPSYEDILNADPPPPSYYETVNECFTFPDLQMTYKQSSSTPSAKPQSIISGKEIIGQSMKKRLGIPEPREPMRNKPKIRKPAHLINHPFSDIDEVQPKSNDNPRLQEQTGYYTFANSPGNIELTIESSSTTTNQSNDYDIQRHQEQKMQDSTANLPRNKNLTHITPIETSYDMPDSTDTIYEAHSFSNYNDQKYEELRNNSHANVSRCNKHMNISFTKTSSVLPNNADNKPCQNYDSDNQGQKAQRLQVNGNLPKKSMMQRLGEQRCQIGLINQNGTSKLKSHDGQRCKDDLTNTHGNSQLQRHDGQRCEGDLTNTLESTELTNKGGSLLQVTVKSKTKGRLPLQCQMYNNRNDPLKMIRQPIVGNVNRSGPLENY